MPSFGNAASESPALRSAPQTDEFALDWWMPRHEAKLAEVRERASEICVVFIGDSITHGWEDTGREFWDRDYAGLGSLNLGFAGDRTEQVIWRLNNGELDSLHPELCVLMIGTNNTGHRMDPADETAAGIEAIVTTIRQKVPAAKILLLGVFPRGATPEDPERKLNEAINAHISHLAVEESVTFFDIGHHFLDGEGMLPTSLMPDGLHPNVLGYEIWADAMTPKLLELLGEKNVSSDKDTP